MSNANNQSYTKHYENYSITCAIQKLRTWYDRIYECVKDFSWFKFFPTLLIIVKYLLHQYVICCLNWDV